MIQLELELPSQHTEYVLFYILHKILIHCTLYKYVQPMEELYHQLSSICSFCNMRIFYTVHFRCRLLWAKPFPILFMDAEGHGTQSEILAVLLPDFGIWVCNWEQNFDEGTQDWKSSFMLTSCQKPHQSQTGSIPRSIPGNKSTVDADTLYTGCNSSIYYLVSCQLITVYAFTASVAQYLCPQRNTTIIPFSF